MKKISIFLVLCLLAISSFEMMVGAESTNVTASVADGTYTVTVTPNVNFGEVKKDDGTVSKVLNVSITYDAGVTPVEVKVAESNDLKLAVADNDSAKLDYQVWNADTNVAAGGIFATFTKAGEVNGSLRLDTAQIVYAGSYTDTLTFEIS